MKILISLEDTPTQENPENVTMHVTGLNAAEIAAGSAAFELLNEIVGFVNNQNDIDKVEVATVNENTGERKNYTLKG